MEISPCSQRFGHCQCPESYLLVLIGELICKLPNKVYFDWCAFFFFTFGLSVRDWGNRCCKYVCAYVSGHTYYVNFKQEPFLGTDTNHLISSRLMIACSSIFTLSVARYWLRCEDTADVQTQLTVIARVKIYGPIHLTTHLCNWLICQVREASLFLDPMWNRFFWS